MTTTKNIKDLKAELRQVNADIDAAIANGEDSLSIAMLIRTGHELADAIYLAKTV